MGIPEVPAVDFSKFGPIETRPLPRIKKISGPHLHRAWLNVPLVTHQDEADITETDVYRKELDAAAKDKGYRVTLLAFLMKASVSALKQFPEFNASLSPEKDSLILKRYYHIGVAVDTPEGFVVPVIRDVDRKGIGDISQELGAVSKKARDGKLGAADMQGASFTISSLGGIGGTAFTPLVNAPEVAILRGRALPDGAGLEWRDLPAAPDAAALGVVRPPRDRWSPGRAVHAPSRPCAGGCSPPGSLTRLPAPDPLLGDNVMSTTTEIHLPDIGDFKDVPVIEVHVQPGSRINVDDTLITLESDKATMDIPATAAGTVREVRVKTGDRVSQGDLIITLDAEGAPAIPPKERIKEEAAPSPGPGQAGYGSPSGVYEAIEVRIPDIGDYKNVPIIEVHVQPGATIKVDDPLITLESDKATMEVPAAQSGTIREVKVKVGDRVSQDDVIAIIEAVQVRQSHRSPTTRPGKVRRATDRRRSRPGLDREGMGTGRPRPAAKPPVAPPGDFHAEVLVLGAGPGGYTAAFRAADLGKKVVLVDRWPSLGGVCLNVGCIPSKALLHAAKVIDETRSMGAHGIGFAEPAIDIEKLRGWKDGVVKRLTGGLAGLAKQRKVTVVPGIGRFVSMNQLEVRSEDGASKIVSFEQAIIAAGSEPVTLPFIPHDDPRVIDSTGALELDGIPQRLLVVGGGIIGLEMATVYHALGAKVTVVELMDQIIPGADKDIVTPLMKRISKQYEAIHLKAKVTKVEANGQGLTVHFEGGSAPATDTFDRILVAVGRRPNGKLIGAENAGIAVDERGFIPSTGRCAPTFRTSLPSATSSASRCWPTRRCTRARSRPRRQPARTRSSTPR